MKLLRFGRSFSCTFLMNALIFSDNGFFLHYKRSNKIFIRPTYNLFSDEKKTLWTPS